MDDGLKIEKRGSDDSDVEGYTNRMKKVIDKKKKKGTLNLN